MTYASTGRRTRVHHRDTLSNRAATAAVAALLGVLFAAPPAAAKTVIAEPRVVVFHSEDARAQVLLRANGQPIAKSAINTTKVYIGDHDYDEFFTISKEEGAITIQPTDATEIGSYELVIDTDHGRARVQVYTPLSDLEGSLEAQAKASGVTVEELKHSLGLFTVPKRERVHFELPPVYYEGQSLVMSMKPPEGRTYEWYVDEQRVDKGTGPNTFTYTFKEPGLHSVKYVEREDGAVIAQAVGATKVVTEPPLTWKVAAGREFTLTAPGGFMNYQWKVDGEPVGSTQSLTHEFAAPGAHSIEVVARRPTPGSNAGYRRITYEVTVTDKTSG